MTVAECAAAPSLRFGMACAEAGDVVLFNGKCLRKNSGAFSICRAVRLANPKCIAILDRGRANHTDATRAVLYVSNYKTWYNDDW